MHRLRPGRRSGPPVSEAATEAPLIVTMDDDVAVTRGIEVLLSQYDVEVVPVCCGRAGMWESLHRSPDLIITDMRMPQGDGEDVISFIRKYPKTAYVPIIVLSGLAGDDVPGRCQNLGADSFLRKPVSQTRLIEEVCQYVELKERNWETAGEPVAAGAASDDARMIREDAQ